MDISVVARLHDALTDLLTREDAARGPKPGLLQGLPSEDVQRFRRHLQCKRLTLVAVAQPASVMAATIDSSFLAVAAQFWRRCPPRNHSFTEAGRYEADSWTSFLGSSGFDRPPWLPDLARFERERYVALLKADTLSPLPGRREALPVGGDDHFELADHASLRTFDFDVVRLRRHFCSEARTTRPPESITGRSQTDLAVICTSPEDGVRASTMSPGTAQLLSQLLRGSSVAEALGELGHDPGTRQFTGGFEIVERLLAGGLLRPRSATARANRHCE
jgi:hypothetical protein